MTSTIANIVRLGSIAAAGTVAGGLLAFPAASYASDGDEAVKRDEDTVDVAVVDDDDDDDTNDPNTDNTGISNDNTGSKVTDVSRDNDRSRGDLTKDMTRDGGDLTRDHSANSTNDASRNDTRR